MLEVSEIEIAALKEQTALANTDSLTRILEALADAELRLRDAASKKILLEVTLLRAIEARNSLSLDAVLKQLNALRGGQSSSGPAPVARTAAVSGASPRSASPAPTATAQVTSAQPAQSASQPTAIPSGNLEELWTKLVESAGRASPFVRTYLMEAHPVSFERNIFTIGFDPEFADHLGLVDNARNHTLLQTKLSEFGHPNSQIKFVKSEAPVGRLRFVPAAAPVAQTSPAPKGTPAAAKPVTSAAPAKQTVSVPFNKDDFKNDPLIQKALEIFKGQIVEVRA